MLTRPRKGQRSSFYGGILDVVVEKASVEELPPSLTIKEYALVHISCFKENNTPIVGNVASKIGEEALILIEKETNNFNVGAKPKVWGYRTIIKYADGVVA